MKKTSDITSDPIDPVEIKEVAQPKFIRIQCLQTGFTADLPIEDWDAYTDDQRAAYTVL